MNYFLFGYNNLYFKPATEQQWIIVMLQEQQQPWVPNRATPEGTVWFDNFSQKVGLSDDQEIQQLSAELIDEMLEITASNQAQCFFPPCQMEHLQTVISATQDPTRITALPEYVLLNDAQPQHTSTMNFTAQDHCYIKDWNVSDQGIVCQPELLSKQPAQTFYAPVLMPATAIEQRQVHIIGRIKQDESLEFFPTQFTIPAQAAQGSRPPVFGLVWVWGWGKRLWQWALPYTQLHETADCKQYLLKQSSNPFELQLYQQNNTDNLQQTFKLKPPVYKIKQQRVS